MAALLLLERLSPLERAVFVLREVFGFGFPEIASTVGRSEAACRQLAVRARRHMDAGRPRFEAGRREREELAEQFFDAFREGDVDGLRELLAADVQWIGGGGKAPQWKTIIGTGNVARVLAAMVPPFVQIAGVVGPHEVNGQPGAIIRDRDGKVISTWALDILDGRIQTIRALINPDKLGHVGPWRMPGRSSARRTRLADPPCSTASSPRPPEPATAPARGCRRTSGATHASRTPSTSDSCAVLGRAGHPDLKSTPT
jgi:RNA polymerase sigma-70 factor, ECF subfamily